MSVDLTTRYLGMTLLGPLGVSACPLTERMDMLPRMEDAGASIVVLPSLFEEQLEHEGLEVARFLDFGSESSPEASDYFPELSLYNTGPDHYLSRIEAAKQAVAIPVLASLNGHTKGGWVRYARLIEGAGADALELNVHFVPTRPEESAADVEARYVDLVAAICESVEIPVAVKLGPYFTAPLHFAQRLAAAGASGLVLFNRLLPADFDLDTLEIVPRPSFSDPRELRLRLQWTGLMRDRVPCDLAATGGVHTGTDILKLLLAGADVVLVASALFGHGIERLRTMLEELRARLEEKEYQSIEQLKGSMSWQNCTEPAAYERLNYMRSLVSFGGESEGVGGAAG